MLHFSSVQLLSHVHSLQPHELQHARPPCPLPTPRVHPESCASSRWCLPAISSSVVPFSSCPQSLPASESFPMSQLFAWGGQSIGVSASASFLATKSQGWSPSEWTGWISLQSKGLSRVFEVPLFSPSIPPTPVSPSIVCITESVHGQLGFLCDPDFLPHFLAIIQQIVGKMWSAEFRGWGQTCSLTSQNVQSVLQGKHAWSKMSLARSHCCSERKRTKGEEKGY